MLGTPCYMSPEQAQGTKAVDHRADLWSLAVIAYRCLVGALPFDSEALGDLLMKIIVQPLPVPSQRAPELPPAFDTWWARGAARDPAQRFQSAKELSEALAQALGMAPPALGRTPVPVEHAPGTEPTYLAGGSQPGPMATPALGGVARAVTPHPATVAHGGPAAAVALEPTQSDPGRLQYPGVLPPPPQHATHSMSPAARTFDGRAPRGRGGALVAAVAVGAGVLGLAAFLLLGRGADAGSTDAGGVVEAAPQATAPAAAPTPSPSAPAPEPVVVAEEPAPEAAPTPAKTAAAVAPRPAAPAAPPRTGKVVVAPPPAPPRTGKVVIAPPR
jgi:serine/threonine-protein kinase